MSCRRFLLCFVLCNTIRIIYCHWDQFQAVNAKINAIKSYLEMEVKSIKVDLMASNAMNLNNVSRICGMIESQCGSSSQLHAGGQDETEVMGQVSGNDGQGEFGECNTVREIQNANEKIQILQKAVVKEKHLRVARERKINRLLQNIQQEINGLRLSNNKTEQTEQTLSAVQDRISNLGDDVESIRNVVEQGSTNISLLHRKLEGHQESGGDLTDCDDDWINFDGACYMLSDRKYTWKAAKRFCAKYGGYLIEVNSRRESEFVIKRAKGVWGINQQIFGWWYWIGGTDAAQEGLWRWDNSWTNIGTNTFSRWKTGEPNNHGNEDCAVLMGDGFWNDVSCDYMFYYACEKRQ